MLDYPRHPENGIALVDLGNSELGVAPWAVCKPTSRGPIAVDEQQKNFLMLLAANHFGLSGPLNVTNPNRDPMSLPICFDPMK